MSKHNQRGMSLAEVLMSLALVSIIIFSMVTVTSTAYTHTRLNNDKQFATQKAISIVEELKSVLQAGATTSLDGYDDGATGSDPHLTVQGQKPTWTTLPNDPISGNTPNGPTNWIWERNISVQRIPGQGNDVRLVNVKIFKNEGPRRRLVAEVASVLRTLVVAMPESQSYDVYCVAVENVPGWWVYMSNIVPFVKNAIADLQARNPGLVFRTHMINTLAYGRDWQYLPFLNNATVSTADVNQVYFYPGSMPGGSADNFYYFPDLFHARVNIDGTTKYGYDATTNPWPYALADQYNNAMRYPDELAYYNLRKLANPAEEPTWRILLEQLYSNPAAYTNAIIINLHGELLPFPPIRNYSDAAKSPALLPNVRAVTHPEQLRYTNADPVKLRVYSYRTDPDTGSANTDYLGQGAVDTPITIKISGTSSWSPVVGDVKMIRGGTDQDGIAGQDAYDTAPQNAPLTTPVGAPNAMWFERQVVGTDTVIKLHNSPLKSPQLGTNRGLKSTERLYGLEYIPSPLEDFTAGNPAAFSTDLTTVSNVPKNTARWIITIPTIAIANDQMLTIETRIGDTTTTGVMYPAANVPPNLSKTYLWRGTDTYIFGGANPVVNPPNLPITEQFQILGDPRHCPYSDLKRPHLGAGLGGGTVENRLGMGYNRNFDDFESTAGGNHASDWPGWTYVPASGVRYGVKNDGTPDNDGWESGGTGTQLDIDVNRLYQVVRTGLLQSSTLWTTMTGFSYYYLGIGNEIGYDTANVFPNSIPVSTKPFTGLSGARNEQTILPDISPPPANVDICDAVGCGTKYIRENNGASSWWSISWLGELYPDSNYSANSNWAVNGNLQTGPNGANNFIRTLRQNFPAYPNQGTQLIKTTRRTEAEGCTNLFWSGTAGSTFHHVGAGATGTINSALGGGTDIATAYNLPVPNTIDAQRPFEINFSDPGNNPELFLGTSYPGANSAIVQKTYYDRTGGAQPDLSSALITLRQATTRKPAFIVVNGLSPTGVSGTNFIARWSFLTLVQSFFNGGLYTNAADTPSTLQHIRQLPRVSITNPNFTTNLSNPSSITVAWTAGWTRWDSQPYTSAYTAPYTLGPPLRFAPLYSPSNGNPDPANGNPTGWLYMQDNTPATLGVRPDVTHEVNALTYSWSTPLATFPEGNYLIRIEGYRVGYNLHYSFHQFRAYIQR